MKEAKTLAGTRRTLERIEAADGFVGYRSPLLHGLGVPHVFTTRRVGEGVALDLVGLGEQTAHRLRRAAGVESARIVGARQVHGVAVHDADRPALEQEVEADALVTTRTDRLLLIRTADCVPVLLASRDGTKVAAVHAGWRGLVAEVLLRALEGFTGKEIAAAVGPCLSLERFEIGEEVAERFEGAGLGCIVRTAPGKKPHADLREAARLQLERCGVQHIDLSDRCTWNDAGDFFSYRRDVTHGGAATTGRLGALIAPRPLAADMPCDESSLRSGSLL